MRSIAHTDLPFRRERTAFGPRMWRLVVGLGVALKVQRERRMLLRLDERALKDMGFNRAEAHTEALRSFWDIPIDRLRR